ncbi:uncharacterized protein LOC108738167 [Agrilus planipennis]|uniref:Uncharacterized protein LOC108738167 n=1 Tax=Agrilus planipennis TaxID=224129 RepID=A0A1W4X2D3_AGRPL|nr:uncharacterized protein LOC108738167 [Agrilus planipennis]
MGKDNAADDTKSRITIMKPKAEPCNLRIHELAKPRTILLLCLWYQYRHFLTPEKCRKLKQTLQEDYSMSPEDAERYFQEINDKIEKIAERRKQKILSRKRWKKKVDQCERKRGYRFFRAFLEKALRLSYQNPVPPLIPSRLKNVMDIVLEQLCDLLKMDIPNEECMTKEGEFIVSLAYNIAAVIENTSYEVNAQKNLELEEIEKQENILKEEEANKGDKEQVVKVTNF